MTASDSTIRKECPTCGDVEVDASFEGVEGICTQCGYVFLTNPLEGYAEELEKALEEFTNATEPREEWADVYKIRNSTEQRIAVALECLEGVATEFSLSADVRSRAASIYGEAAKQGSTDGRKTECVVGAVLCLTLREMGEPIPISKVSQKLGVNKRQIGRATKQLQTELGIDPPTCPAEDYVKPLCDILGVDEEIASEALSRVCEARRQGLVDGKNPAGVAAAAIYESAEGKITQRQIADGAGVSRETLRHRLRDFRQGGVGDV